MRKSKISHTWRPGAQLAESKCPVCSDRMRAKGAPSILAETHVQETPFAHFMPCVENRFMCLLRLEMLLGAEMLGPRKFSGYRNTI